jgi:hypothetical protein
MKIYVAFIISVLAISIAGCSREVPQPTANTLPAVDPAAITSIAAAVNAAEKQERRNPDNILPARFQAVIMKTYDFTLPNDIQGFGVKGDRIWQVYMPSVVRSGQKRHAWVNAKTGHVKFLAKYETYGDPEQPAAQLQSEGAPSD